MQYLQPMHLFSSTVTTPFSSMELAPVGQTLTHGASSQCMHCSGTVSQATFGSVPISRSS